MPKRHWLGGSGAEGGAGAGLEVAAAAPGRTQEKNSSRAMLYTLFVGGDETESSTSAFNRCHSAILSTTVISFIFSHVWAIMGHNASHDDLISGLRRTASAIVSRAGRPGAARCRKMSSRGTGFTSEARKPGATNLRRARGALPGTESKQRKCYERIAI